MLYEYIRDYYFPIMKIESVETTNTFLKEVEKIETSKTVEDSFLEAYNHLINHIRNEIKDYTYINTHFNRMRFHMIHQFKSIPNFPNLEYISF